MLSSFYIQDSLVNCEDGGMEKQGTSSGDKQNRKPIEVFQLPASQNNSQPIFGTGDNKPEVGSNTSLGSTTSSSINNRELINKWMAFEREGSSNKSSSKKGNAEVEEESKGIITEKASIAERTAEWGLVVTDVGERSFKAIGKLSGEGERAKNSLESTRTSGESVSGSESAFPRVSQELKDALATLQQTFVVSDATKPECPIMYASNGFFTMTGYSSKEIIGRNW